MRLTLFSVLCCLLLTACAEKQPQPSPPTRRECLDQSSQTASASRSPDVPTPFDADNSRPATPLPSTLPHRAAGGASGDLTAGLRAAPRAGDNQERPISLRLEKAPLAKVAAMLFGEELQVDYAIDPILKTEISLHIEGRYTGDELLDLAAQALRTHGVDVVRQGGMTILRPMKQGGDGFSLTGGHGLPRLAVFRLRHLKAEQAMKSVEKFLGQDRHMVADPATNSLLFVDAAENAEQVLTLLRTLDVNLLAEVGFEVIPVTAIPAKEAAARAREIVSSLAGLKETGAAEKILFIPLQQFPGVLVLSRDSQAIASARQWIRALDLQHEAAGEQVHIYHVKNGLAVRMAEILGQLFQTRSSSPGAAKSQLPQELTAADVKAPQRMEASVAVTLEAGNNQLDGPATIVADPDNNALVIRAAPRDLDTILRVLERMDIMPRAVLIKVIIAEVDLNDELSYGVEWFLRTNKFNLAGQDVYASSGFDLGSSFDRAYDLGSSASGAIPQGLSLFAGSLGGTNEFAVLVDLLKAKNAVRILSSPSLLAMDNQPASFTVGGREPTVSRTSQNTASDSTIVNNISYEDTGIILSVTPHINAGGLVRLEVEQRITSVNEQAIPGVNLNTPRFTERLLKTALFARDGQTVVMGGIMQQKNNKRKSGIPILSDIPGLSLLTSRTADKVESTELLLAITPHVVTSGEEPVHLELLHQLEAAKRALGDGKTIFEEEAPQGQRP